MSKGTSSTKYLDLLNKSLLVTLVHHLCKATINKYLLVMLVHHLCKAAIVLNIFKYIITITKHHNITIIGLLSIKLIFVCDQDMMRSVCMRQ